MASSREPLCLLIFITQLLFFCSSSIAQTSFRLRALVLPVTKIQSSNQYVATFKQRTPLVQLNLTVDLGGEFLWVDCFDSYVSSSYRPARCRSAECSLANSKACGSCSADPKPGCNNNTCVLFPWNPFAAISTIGEVASDVLALRSTDGSNPGRFVSAPRVLFVCSAALLLEGLAGGGVKGMAALGRGRMGLPSQLASAFSFHRKFAVCLGSNNGVIFFGDGPYLMLPNIDVSKSLIYTPLLRGPSADYFIGVKSIQINEKAIPVNTTLLTIDKEGDGGTKISTIQPYTVMQTSIYNALTEAFAEALAQVPRVNPVAPFKLCYNSSNLGSTRVGPGVPSIDLVLQSKSVIWRIFGANSMVRVNDDVLCLGFVDGGVQLRASIVIGGHQIEDNLLQFDLAASRLGFSSSLLFQRTTCSNFNFTTNA